LAQKNRKGVVILIKKWDLVEKETMTARDYEKRVREQIAPFTDVPILCISALTKQRLLKALEAAVKVYENRKQRIATSMFNHTMWTIIHNYPPSLIKAKYVTIKYCMQFAAPTPQFVFFVNLQHYIKVPYKRFVENKLREIYDCEGVPIDLDFRQK